MPLYDTPLQDGQTFVSLTQALPLQYEKESSGGKKGGKHR
jgi:hypothetical protein